MILSKPWKRRQKSVSSDRVSFRKKQFQIRCIVSVPITLYLSYAISGIYSEKVDFKWRHIYQSLLYCILHPSKDYNDKTVIIMFLGMLIWMVVAAQAWVKLSYNLMHGEEYGTAKWGDIAAFNKKYAASEEEVQESNQKKLPVNLQNETIAEYQEIAKHTEGKKEKHLAEKNVKKLKQKQKKELKKMEKQMDNIHPMNKVLSENVRFRYKSDTLRNNNIFVVGGSGDCGIIVTGRTNPVKSRVCEA